MKTGHQRNYTLIALAIVYFIIAVIQICFDGILETQLYFSVAFISINTTLCELIKSMLNWIRTLRRRQNEIKIDEQNLVKRHIEVLGQYSCLFDLVEQHQKKYESLENDSEPEKKIRRAKTLDVIESVISFVEILSILSIAIITPLNIIPNSLQTTKVIDVLSLLSIAFAFLSVHINESISQMINQDRKIIGYSSHLSDYYLDIIDSISNNHICDEESIASEKEKGGHNL